MKSLHESLLDIDKTVNDIDHRMSIVKEWTMSTEDWMKKHKKDVFGKWINYYSEPIGVSLSDEYKERMYIIGCNKPIEEFNGGTGYLYCVVMNAFPNRPNSGKQVSVMLKPENPTPSSLDNYLSSDYDFCMTTNCINDKKQSLYYARKILHLLTIMAEFNPDQFYNFWEDHNGIHSDNGCLPTYDIDDLTLDI